jgi:hypothetical protein
MTVPADFRTNSDIHGIRVRHNAGLPESDM